MYGNFVMRTISSHLLCFFFSSLFVCFVVVFVLQGGKRTDWTNGRDRNGRCRGRYFISRPIVFTEIEKLKNNVP